MNKVYHTPKIQQKKICKNTVKKSNKFNYYKNKFKELKSFNIEKFKRISKTNTFLELHIGFGTSLFIKKVINKENVDCLLISDYINNQQLLNDFVKNLIEDDVAKYLK